MPRYCSACKAIEIPWDKSRRFHAFPKNDEARKKWLAAIGRESVANRAHLCSDHFLDSCYRPNDDYPSDRRLLEPNAVPTIKLSNAETAPESCMSKTTENQNRVVEEKATASVDNSIIMTSTCDISDDSVLGPHPTHNNTHESDAAEQQPMPSNNSCDEVAIQEVDILRRASIFRRKDPACHLQNKPKQMKHSDSTCQAMSSPEKNTGVEGSQGSPMCEPFDGYHELKSSQSSGSEFSSDNMDNESDNDQDPGNKRANEDSHEEISVTREADDLKRKKPADDQETPPRKMLSRTTSNLDTMRMGLEKKKIEIDETDALPNKIRFMNGDEIVELSRSEFNSQEVFRKVLLMKRVLDRQIHTVNKRMSRSDKKIPELRGLVKKLEEEKEFAAANYLKVPD